ncbi:MAG: metal-dependent transcriptional regulator [Dehalococcoidia bacterium]|nr:metal-dependent transcriptional regulator [Dehalococcoidia bacterium]
MEQLGEKAEELLETLWIKTEEAKQDSMALADLPAGEQEPVAHLKEAGYISSSDSRIKLTDRGRAAASNVVRRHRLAERLLADVLGTGEKSMHERACRFEHLIDPGLEESICALLGHPKICPHGKPIPPGRCCQQGQRHGTKLVASLSQLVPGQKGAVAYVYASGSNQLQKLMAMGVLPGAPITLIQRFPSFVFQIRQTQFAVDKEIADTIYVRLTDQEDESAAEPARHRRRFGLGRW